MRPIDADALNDNMFHYAAPEMVWDRGDIEHKINEMPTIDAIPVEWLMKYAQLPTEFAIAAWRKQDKDAQEKRIKRLDKPMSFDDALNLVNDVFPLVQKEQEAR
jgi:hypothetical protein